MILTREILDSGKSKYGGWSKSQLACFGVAWPLKHGWTHTIIGEEFEQDLIDTFLSLKDAHITARVVRKHTRKHPESSSDRRREASEFEYALDNELSKS